MKTGEMAAAPFDPPWFPPPEHLSLGSGAVHVWRASLDLSPSQIERFRGTLDDDERSRADRFYFSRDRERFIVARGVLRALLGRYLNRAPESLSFSYSTHGKPALVSESGADAIRFNLSHSHGTALYAVTCGREIGVDLEFIRCDLEAEQIAERFFSHSEIVALRALPLEPSEIRLLSLLDPQRSLHQGQRGRTLDAPGPVRRVADSRRTCGAIEHPTRYRRSPSLVSAEPDPRFRLRCCSCHQRTRLDSVLLAMARGSGLSVNRALAR